MHHISFEEYIRSLLLGPLSDLRSGLRLNNERTDIYEGLVRYSGDYEELSWRAKNGIIVLLMPIIKQLILDVIDQYRMVTGDGFTWDMIVPDIKRLEPGRVPLYKKLWQERWEYVDSLLTEEQRAKVQYWLLEKPLRDMGMKSSGITETLEGIKKDAN